MHRRYASQLDRNERGSGWAGVPRLHRRDRQGRHQGGADPDLCARALYAEQGGD